MTKTSTGALVLATLLLASCAQQPGGPGWDGGGPGMRGGGPHMMAGGPRFLRGNPNFPNVEVVNDEIIVVDQEPVFMPRNYVDKKISWQLPNGGPYKFDHDRGIVVEGEKTSGHVAFTDCKPEQNDYRFVCKNDGTAGWYKYTIRVVGPANIPPLDPFIRNG